MSLELSTEDLPFICSETAIKIRQQLAANIRAQREALVAAAMDSTDPKVRGIAASLVTFNNVLAALKPPKDTTDE